jgi:hypothetical protein
MSRLREFLTRPRALPIGFVAVVAVILAGVMYARAGREARRNRAATEAMTAWIQDMAEQHDDLRRFVPKAREALALQRDNRADESAARATMLATYAVLAGLSHLDFMTHSEPPAPVRQFEADVLNELVDIVLSLLERGDDRGLAFAMAFTGGDECDTVRDGKCDRAVMEAARLAARRVTAGDKDLTKLAASFADRLNALAWDEVKQAGKTSAVYALALERAAAAASAKPEDANITNTLALAQCRAGQVEQARATIARAVTLRNATPLHQDDLAVQALTDAKAGRTGDARATLDTLERRFAKAAADATKKGNQPSIDKTVLSLMAEARTLLASR